MAAAVEGLSKFRDAMLDCPARPDVAGDFLYCCGDERWPRGENAAWAALEKGVDTGGVAAASCEGVLPCCPEGVRPCCDGACFMGVGVDIFEAVM